MAVPRTLFAVHTTGVIIVLFLICVFLINGGISEEEIGSPLRVAQCRARCIKTVSINILLLLRFHNTQNKESPNS